MVSDPFFEADKRGEILSNISSMGKQDKEKYRYIWLAELGSPNSSSKLVQFDSRGEEKNYRHVRDKISENAVDGLYWVPVKSGWNSYGVKPSSVDESVELMRRGFVQHGPSGAVISNGFVPFIRVGDQCLYLGPEKDFRIDDIELNVLEAFNLGE